jgi:thiamine biosynthesis lipoprotein
MEKNKRNALIVVILALGFLLWNHDGDTKHEYTSFQGFIFGTTYSVIYEAPEGLDYREELNQHLLAVVDSSLSTFNKASVISLINENKVHVTDSAFEAVFNRALELSELTDGAFDMTVAPLVNAWGFGYEGEEGALPSQEGIDSLLSIVGYQTVKLIDHRVIKEFAETKLDASAIAKGYSVDVAAEFLASKGVTNYMVEIGGEIRVAGMNKFGKKWRLGIDKPMEDPCLSHRELDTILYLTDKALATSGNYRQYYYKNGKRYSHTIDPRTGYPVDHQLLSATVIADDCMTADAIATACMVMGVDGSLDLAAKMEGVEVYLISDVSGQAQPFYSDGLVPFLQP